MEIQNDKEYLEALAQIDQLLVGHKKVVIRFRNCLYPGEPFVKAGWGVYCPDERYALATLYIGPELIICRQWYDNGFMRN